MVSSWCRHGVVMVSSWCRHGVEYLEFATVPSCDQSVVGPTQAQIGTLDFRMFAT